MTDDFFTTEFGRTIKFVPGHFEANEPYVQYLDAQSHTHELTTMKQGKLPWGNPAKDLVEFSGMIAFMQRFGLLRKFENSIDLGGAEGTVSALLRSLDLVQHATNLDLINFTPQTGPDYFKEFLQLMYSDSPAKAALEKGIRKAKFTFDYVPDQPYLSCLFFGKPELAVVDHHIHGTVESATGSYDLISAFSCFEHLDLDSALAKTRSLLKPGGVFVSQNEAWYWVYNSLGVIGHFPYTAARLTHADIDRYLSQFHPTLVAGYRRRVEQIRQTQQRPTIKDWFDLGRKHGLRPVAVERIMPRQHSQITPCPPKLFMKDYFDHREVLADIHMFEPNVSTDDLLTYAIRIAMVAV